MEQLFSEIQIANAMALKQLQECKKKLYLKLEDQFLGDKEQATAKEYSIIHGFHMPFLK